MAEEQEVPLERLQEQIKERKEEEDEGGEPERTGFGRLSRRRYINLLAVSTAIFAVLAAIASLASGSYANEALYDANRAVLLQDRATDTWNEYQAARIKRIQYENQAQLLQQQNAAAPLVATVTANAKKQADKQQPLKLSAQQLEDQGKDLEREAESQLAHHHRFSYSVTLFQVAIGLAALAALVNRQELWWVSLLTGVLGFAVMLYGFMAISATRPKNEAPSGPATGTPGATRVIPALPAMQIQGLRY